MPPLIKPAQKLPLIMLLATLPPSVDIVLVLMKNLNISSEVFMSFSLIIIMIIIINEQQQQAAAATAAAAAATAAAPVEVTAGENGTEGGRRRPAQAGARYDCGPPDGCDPG